MATFHLGPRAGRAEVTTRVRLNGTQRVRAVAQLSDGSYWSGDAELDSGVAANPYVQFYAIAEASGEIEFSWVDDAGARGSERATITVGV